MGKYLLVYFHCRNSNMSFKFQIVTLYYKFFYRKSFYIPYNDVSPAYAILFCVFENFLISYFPLVIFC